MPNDNLDETHDSLIPVGNPFDIPLGLLTEIVQEALRASKAKSISKSDLEKYLNNGENWKVKVLIAGSISNMVIRNDIEGEHCLQTLNSFPEEFVIKELVKLLISQLIIQRTTVSQRKVRKSSARIPVNTTSNTRRENRSNKPILPSQTSPNNNSFILVICGVLVLVFVVGGIVFFNKNNEPTVVASAPEERAVEVSIEKEPVEHEPASLEIEANKSEVAVPEKTTVSETEATVKMLEVKDGLINLQAGRQDFLKGDIYSLEGTKKISKSPFLVNGNETKAISRMFFDIRHIPKKVIIGSAKLMINVSFDQDQAREMLIYCYGSAENNTYAFEDLLAKKDLSVRHEVVLRNEWVSFDVTKACQEWINNGAINNGFWLYTDKKVRFLFQGFEGQRTMLSPKLLMTILDKKKEVPVKSVSAPAVEDKKDSKDGEDNLLANELKADPSDKKIVEKTVKEAVVAKEDKASEATESDDAIKSLLDQANNGELLDLDETKDEVKSDAKKEVTKEKVSSDLTMGEKEVAKSEPVKTVKEGGLKNSLSQKTPENGELPAGPLIEVSSRLLNATDKIVVKNEMGQGEIRYTYDGQEPVADSLLMTGEEIDTDFSLNKHNAKLQLAVFLDGKRISKISEKIIRVATSANLIDNNFSRCKRTGKWDVGKNDKNQHGRDYLYVYRTGKKTNNVIWQPIVRVKSKYEVYIWLPDGDFTRADNATYIVHSEEGDKSIEINQKEVGKAWIYLGEYTLDQGNAHNLELIDDKQGKVIIADAAYFHPVDSGD